MLLRPMLAMSATLLLASAALAQNNGRPAPKVRPDSPFAGAQGGKPAQSPVDQALAKPLVTTVYHWQVGANPVKGPPASTHICLLTKVAGDFAGAGERVALYIDGGAVGGPRWILNGTSGQPELMAEATCAAKAQFAPAVGNPSQLVGISYDHHENGNCADHIVQMPDMADKHAFFISGIAGKFRGGGESVTAFRQGVKGAIKVNGCSGYVDGTLLSIGDATVPKVMFRTPSARVPAGSKNINFGASLSGPKSTSFLKTLGDMFSFKIGEDLSVDETTPGTTVMVPQDEALCGIVGIVGKLQGYGEEVSVLKQGGYWKLHVNEQGEDASIAAVSRCFARDQRP